jgi:hypothetical protein
MLKKFLDVSIFLILFLAFIYFMQLWLNFHVEQNITSVSLGEQYVFIVGSLTALTILYLVKILSWLIESFQSFLVLKFKRN